MICPSCGADNDKVIDTRPFDENKTIRRRRECLECGHRYSTIERIEGRRLCVVKKDGSRQDFSREKLMNSIAIACSKRPVPSRDLMSIVNEVEALIQEQHSCELSTDRIGQLVMDRLMTLDKVAYVRFASVYRDFGSISSFTKEISKISDDKE